jgi:hypothetical protein
VFSRRAGAADVAAELSTCYPRASADLAATFTAPAPRRGPRLTAWVHDQVRLAAVRLAAATTGLDQVPYPADGEESLRVYLSDDLADLPTHAVPSAAWSRAREDAWSDHGDALEADREQDWAERLADEVETTLRAWRAG